MAFVPEKVYFVSKSTCHTCSLTLHNLHVICSLSFLSVVICFRHLIRPTVAVGFAKQIILNFIDKYFPLQFVHDYTCGKNYFLAQFRVTNHVVQNLPLISKQKFCFGLAWPGQSKTFVLKSTGGLWQRDVSPCIYYPILILPSLKSCVVAHMGISSATSFWTLQGRLHFKSFLILCST